MGGAEARPVKRTKRRRMNVGYYFGLGLVLMVALVIVSSSSEVHSMSKNMHLDRSNVQVTKQDAEQVQQLAASTEGPSAGGEAQQSVEVRPQTEGAATGAEGSLVPSEEDDVEGGSPEQGAEPGAELGAEPGAELGAELGAEPGAEPGAESILDPSLDAELDAGSESSVGTGAELDAEADVQPGAEPSAQTQTADQKRAGAEEALKLLENRAREYWDANCRACTEPDCSEDLSFDAVLKQQGSPNYTCSGSYTVLCCSRISDDTRSKIRALVLSKFGPWMEEGIQRDERDAALALVRANQYSSFFVQVVSGEMLLHIDDSSIHWQHDLQTCSANRNDVVDGVRLGRSKSASESGSDFFQDRPGNRLRLKNVLQLVQHYVDLNGESVPNLEFAAGSSDGPGPHPSEAQERPFSTFGILTTNLAPTLTFPKQDNERDVDVARWDEVRRWNGACLERSPWDAKEAKACFRGALRNSAYCNGFTESGSPDKFGKVNAENWKDVARSRMIHLRQTDPDLFDVNFSDLARKAGELGIDLSDASFDEPQRMSMAEQARRFKYQLNIEGNLGWADRLRYLLLGDAVPISQHSPSHEWFEPLFEPGVHFLSTDSNMQNLTEVVRWARANDEKCRRMASESAKLAQEVFSIEAQTLYGAMMLEMHSHLSVGDIGVRSGVKVTCDASGECKFRNGASEHRQAVSAS